MQGNWCITQQNFYSPNTQVRGSWCITQHNFHSSNTQVRGIGTLRSTTFTLPTRRCEELVHYSAKLSLFQHAGAGDWVLRSTTFAFAMECKEYTNSLAPSVRPLILIGLLRININRLHLSIWFLNHPRKNISLSLCVYQTSHSSNISTEEKLHRVNGTFLNT